MPQYYVNTFSPLTPIGQAMQNISLALFGGKTPAEQEQEAARARAYGASAEHSLASAAKARAEAEAIARGEAERPLMRQRALQAATGLTTPELDVTGKFYGGEAYPDEGRQQTVAPGFGVKPSFLTPERERGYRAAEAGMAAAGLGDKTNAEQMLHAQTRAQEQMLADAIMAGSVDPTRASQASYATGRSTKAPYDVQADIIGNVLTGQGQLTGLGRARAGAEGALARQRDKTGEKETALAGLYRAKTETPEKFRAPGAGAGTLVPVVDEDGNVVWQTREAAVGEQVGAKPTAAGRVPSGKSVAPSDTQLEQIQASLAKAYGYSDPADAASELADVWTEATSAAVTNWQQSGNPIQAAQKAVREFPKVVQPGWVARMFGAPMKPTAAPAAAPPVKPVPPTGAATPVPNFAKLHADAKAAITARPDRAAEIKARFKQMAGVDFAETY